MIKILHYLKDPKLWELWCIPIIMGNAGLISSTVVPWALGLGRDTTIMEFQVPKQGTDNFGRWGLLCLHFRFDCASCAGHSGLRFQAQRGGAQKTSMVRRMIGAALSGLSSPEMHPPTSTHESQNALMRTEIVLLLCRFQARSQRDGRAARLRRR